MRKFVIVILFIFFFQLYNLNNHIKNLKKNKFQRLIFGEIKETIVYNVMHSSVKDNYSSIKSNYSNLTENYNNMKIIYK